MSWNYGQAASHGIANGKAVVCLQSTAQSFERPTDSSANELTRWRSAVQKSEIDLKRAVDLRSQGSEKGVELGILEAHLQFLQDPEYLTMIETEILSGSSAESACASVTQQFVGMFLSTGDELMIARSADLRDLSRRLMHYCVTPGEAYPELILNEPSILIANELEPSLLISVDRSNLRGLISSHGSATAHASILARSWEIPFLVQADASLENIRSGDDLVLEVSASGPCRFALSSGLDELELSDFFERKKSWLSEREKMSTWAQKPSRTQCGLTLSLGANIGGPDDMDSVLRNGADAIGLYRTEFMFLDRDSAPNEFEQMSTIHKVCKQWQGKSIVIRTLDVGGDKHCSYLNVRAESNPFLGYRATRILIDRPDLFRTQVRAILRGAVGVDLSILFPMISNLEEVKSCASMVATCLQELEVEGVSYNQSPKLGIMLEIPAAVLQLREFAPYLQFVSFGTNDLLQYTMAADRMNEQVKHLYDPTNLGFLRLMELGTREAIATGLGVSICGSTAHDWRLVPRFLEWGIRSFSMTAQYIPPLRKSLSEVSIGSNLSIHPPPH